jgi:hypothetical protein
VRLGQLGVELRLVVRGELLHSFPEHICLLDREQRLPADVLGERRDIAVVDQVDAVQVLVDV